MKKAIEVDGAEGSGLKPIDCLGHCGKKFVPLHRFNKVCPSCEKHNQGINGREYRATRSAD